MTITASTQDFFSDGYTTARARFRAAALEAGATLHALPLAGEGPDGAALTIDIAWLGPARAARAVVHSSGLHGVEGFAGSAIQLALLDRRPAPPPDTALVVVHALNPYGMAWLRRCNENNVDLNRNFPDATPRRGAPPSYRRLDPLLNPASPPRVDHFFLRAACHVARHGLDPLKQAVAGGQFEYPRGLFFGGQDMEPGPALYQSWLAEHLSHARRVDAVDVHTGLGPWAHDSLVASSPHDGLEPLEAALGRSIARNVDGASVSYRIRGSYPRAFDVLGPDTRARVITQEFGTYSSVRVLHALREENRAHLYADADPSHPAKRRLRRIFAPPSGRWRRQVVLRGVHLVETLLRVDEDGPPTE